LSEVKRVVERQALHPRLEVRADQPLIGIPLPTDGEEVTHYFTDDDAADAAVSDSAIEDALSVIGAWSDIPWEEMAEALDRIRHESKPTPPIDLDL
jgi:hypothetical protein